MPGDPTTLPRYRQSTRVGAMLRHLFAGFDAADIAYCVLHDYDQLPDRAPSDVDIAIDPARRRDAARLVRTAAAAHGAHVVQRIHYDIPWCYFYVVAWHEDDGAPRFLQIDLLADHRGIGAYRIASTTLLDGRRRHGCFCRPAAAVEATYLLLKRSRKGRLGVDDRGRIVAGIEEDRAGCDALFRRHFGDDPWPRIDALLTSDDEHHPALPSLARSARRRLWRRPAAAVNAAVRRGLRVVTRLGRPTGLHLGLLAPDGGGKSTVAAALRERVAPAFRRTAAMHWRPYLLPQPSRVLPGVRPPRPPSTPHARPPMGRAVSLLRFTYYWCDYQLGYWPRLWWPKVCSTLTVVERYAYDFVVDRRRSRLRLPDWLVHAAVATIPKLDLVVVLTGTPARIHARKQELDEREIERQLAILAQIAERTPSAHSVSTEQSLDRELLEIEQIVFATLAAREERRWR